MKNTKENAEQFILNFGNGKSFVDRLQGISDFVELLTEYGSKVKNHYIPNDAHSFEVFAIKDSEDSPSGKRAFIGFKLDNGNFNFIDVPYTEPIKFQQKPQLNINDVRSTFLMLIRCIEKMFCKHKDKIELHRCYQDRYVSEVCNDCGKVIYSDL